MVVVVGTTSKSDRVHCFNHLYWNNLLKMYIRSRSYTSYNAISMSLHGSTKTNTPIFPPKCFLSKNLHNPSIQRIPKLRLSPLQIEKPTPQRSGHPQHNCTSFSQLTSRLESFGHKSTPFHFGLDWGLLPEIAASTKMSMAYNAKR